MKIGALKIKWQYKFPRICDFFFQNGVFPTTNVIALKDRSHVSKSYDRNIEIRL